MLLGIVEINMDDLYNRAVVHSSIHHLFCYYIYHSTF